MFGTRNNTSPSTPNSSRFIPGFIVILPPAASSRLGAYPSRLRTHHPNSQFPAMSNTECGRLISVLAFYIFSCSCLHSSQTRKPSRRARNESQFLWREEIESGPIPSFVRNNSSRQSSGGSSRLNTKSSHEISTPSFSKPPSQFSLPATLSTGPQPLENLVSPAEKHKSRRIATVTISELPKIHPPINDRHPPIVSALPKTKTAIAWMTLPPPPARVMRAINRSAHINKASQRDGIDKPLGVTFDSSTIMPVGIESYGCGRGWERHYQADSAASNSTQPSVLLKPARERPHGVPFCPTFSTQSDVEYECHFFDPIIDRTKAHVLSHDEEILYRTPPSSAATFVEVIQRPPPVLKSTFSPLRGLDGFEDLYG